MTTEIVDIEYREYTTEGRWISSATFTSTPSLIREDTTTLLDPEITIQVTDEYRRLGVISEQESVKELWDTNIIVRDPSTGRFMKWKYI